MIIINKNSEGRVVVIRAATRTTITTTAIIRMLIVDSRYCSSGVVAGWQAERSIIS
jgi:hypothetical protein